MVVVADHGITIHPETEHQRVITPETIGSVAAVPLFVKYPEETTDAPLPGAIDDLRAETADLLPTIAEIVDVNVPWRVDGVSLLDSEARAARRSSVMLGSKGSVDIPVDDRSVREVAAEKESWFPGGDPYALVPEGWGALMGFGPVAGSDDEEISISVDQAPEIAAFVPGADPIPSYISGTLEGPVDIEDILAVVVNDTVVAVTRPYEVEGSKARWEAMIPPSLLDAGGAAVGVWLVEGSAPAPAFIH